MNTVKWSEIQRFLSDNLKHYSLEQISFIPDQALYNAFDTAGYELKSREPLVAIRKGKNGTSK